MFSDKYKAKIREKLNGQLLQGNRILVVKEKHGTRYFDARTASSFAMACLKLLKERRDKGYYDVEEPRIKEPAVSKEQVKAIDDGAIKLAALKEWAQYNDQWADYEEDRAILVEANKAIQTEDGLLAWCILRHRDNHQYEEVELEALE